MGKQQKMNKTESETETETETQTQTDNKKLPESQRSMLSKKRKCKALVLTQM